MLRNQVRSMCNKLHIYIVLQRGLWGLVLIKIVSDDWRLFDVIPIDNYS